MISPRVILHHLSSVSLLTVKLHRAPVWVICHRHKSCERVKARFEFVLDLVYSHYHFSQECIEIVWRNHTSMALGVALGGDTNCIDFSPVNFP